MTSNIHSTAIVAPEAKIADSAIIGPFCSIGPNVSIENSVLLKSHVVVDGYTTIGAGTTVYPFSSLGLAPQHSAFKGEKSNLVIGKNNVIRENVTMHPGTNAGRMTTIIGDNCLFMVGSHVAHDCIIGNHCIIATKPTSGGRELEDQIGTPTPVQSLRSSRRRPA